MLRFGRQRQRREERAHLVTMESKKDAFRNLEGAGVIDSITKGRGETSGAQRVRSEAREPGGEKGGDPFGHPRCGGERETCGPPGRRLWHNL